MLKMQFMITEKYLIQDRKHRLWDNIDTFGRMQIWQLTHRKDIVDTIINKQMIFPDNQEEDMVSCSNSLF